jgi:hypothetical protein
MPPSTNSLLFIVPEGHFEILLFVITAIVCGLTTAQVVDTFPLYRDFTAYLPEENFGSPS